MAIPSQEQLVEGSVVEVWSPYSGEWSHGFLVEHLEDDVVLLRRTSDNQVLPVTLPLERVRVAGPEPVWGSPH
jgi:hypothetical protein